MKFLTTVLIFLVSAQTCQAQATQNIDGAVPVFCRDSTGTYQPMQRTTYARLQEGFVSQFGWRHLLQSTSNSAGVLGFAPDPETKSRERIYYDVEPYSGGIALLHMHVRLRGKAEDLSGTPMCMRTFGIVNIR